MRALVVEAVPAAALRALAIAREVRDTVVRRDIVLTGYVEHAVGLHFLENLVGRVELGRLGELRDVARMQYERRPLRERVELRDRLTQGGPHIRVGFLVEANVAVADLGEEDALLLGLGEKWRAADCERFRDAGIHGPHRR